MSTPKNILSQARAIRKLITSLVEDEFTWHAYYSPFTQWNAHINVTKEQALLILAAVNLLGVETKPIISFFISSKFTVKLRLSQCNNHLRVVFVCNQEASWDIEDGREFYLDPNLVR